MKPINWDDLRVFLAFSRGKTATAAARHLNVNYSTVGRRLKQLEERLGSRLFDNHNGNMSLTPAGFTLKKYAEEMELQAQSIDRFVSGQDRAMAGPVVVTAPTTLSSLFILPALKDFKLQYPEVELSIINTPRMMNMSAKEADIALRLTVEPPENLIGRAIFGLQHGLYLLSDTDPDNLGLILFDSDEELPEWASRHFTGKSVSLRVSERSAMLAAVRAGLGIARLPCYMADMEPKLRRLDLELIPSDFKLWLLSHPDLRGNARVATCKKHLQQYLEAQSDLFLGKRSLYLK